MSDFFVKLSSSVGVKLYVMVIGFIVTFMTYNVLGSKGRGEIAIILTWIAILQTVLYFSLGQIAYKKVIDNVISRESALRSILTFDLLVFFLIYFFGVLIYIFAIPQNSVNPLTFLFALIAVPLLIMEQQLLSLNLADNNIQWINKVVFLSKTIGFVFYFVFFFVLKYQSTMLFFVFYNINLLLSVFIYFVFYCKKIKITSLKLDFYNMWEMIKDSIAFHSNAIGYALIINSPIIVLSWIVDVNQVAHFEMSMKLLSIFLVVGQAFQTIIMGQFSKGNFILGWQHYKTCLLWLMIILMASIFISYFVAPYIIPIIIKNESESVLMLFKSLLFIVIPMNLMQILISIYLVRSWHWQISFIHFVVGVLSVISGFYFVKKFGVNGIIYSQWVTYSAILFVFLLTILFVNKLVNNEKI